jgi:hypothetical protein
MSRSKFSLVLSLSILATAGKLAGQSNEQTDVRLRNDCRLAAQALRTGHPSPHYDWAVGYIKNCDVTGPSTVITLWRDNLPRNRDDVRMLGAMTRAFPLRAVYDVVRGVAENEGANTDARIVAIELLASFTAPEVGLSSRDLFDPPVGRRPSVVSVTGTHHPVGELGGDRSETQAILTRIRARTGVFLVRNAADQYLHLLAVLAHTER